MMLAKFKEAASAAWSRVVTWFHDSETNFLSQLWMAVGVVGLAVDSLDPGAVRGAVEAISPAALPFVLIGLGLLHFWAIRRRNPDFRVK
jgi:hypothetical protein